MENGSVDKKLLELGAEMFNGNKCFWTPEDLKRIYDIYNEINGTNEVDTGCPSCRRNKINEVRNYYQILLRNLN